MLFTFALGAAAGDLVSERMDLGYRLAAVLFAAGRRHRRGRLLEADASVEAA
ncbi:hypothetical protein ACWGH3_26230 [Streptomyces sp. NPDC054884]|uniref:hypothetical protein n=1 Tax=Streptomyces sp. ME08-AFT2 TaxID=3028683 RepID=UPI0039F6E250